MIPVTNRNIQGCNAARQRVCFGYKMSQVQIPSSLILIHASSFGGRTSFQQIDFRIFFFCKEKDTPKFCFLPAECGGKLRHLLYLSNLRMTLRIEAPLVQSGRTRVSKTRCRRFESYRACLLPFTRGLLIRNIEIISVKYKILKKRIQPICCRRNSPLCLFSKSDKQIFSYKYQKLLSH